MERRASHVMAILLSGIVSVIGSAWIVKFLDITSLIVPGLDLCAGLVSGGISRIVISLAGHDYATMMQLQMPTSRVFVDIIKMNRNMMCTRTNSPGL
jgi:hypothetical protein